MEKENYEILWEQTFLPILEKKVSSISFSTYIAQLKPVDIQGNTIVLLCKAQIIADAIKNNRIATQLRDGIISANTSINDYSIVVGNDRDDYLNQLDESAREIIDTHASPINPKFTFNSFVVGPSNEFLFAAAKAVAENPGDSYNPLFIYGGTGLGKTHILQAIANYLKINNPSLNVLYSTCEQFTNQMVEAISRGKNMGAGFRNKYRNVDVLLIDDVQFLAGRKSTQMEFFHTFNELVLQNKQVVVACDRPPREIDLLEDRLRTRFEGGLLADVQAPDIETKIAILKRKAEEQKCVVDIKVLSYIAEKDDVDIRTLIGKLTKVVFASKLHERPITIDLVNEALRESASETQEDLKADDIISCVSNFYKISKNDMLGKRRNKEVVMPRQVCVYLMCEMLPVPLMTVGKIMGGRDHATVSYTRDKIAEQIKTDSKLAVAINDIKKMLLKQ